MDKEWENFWMTGKVTDYLNYKDKYKEEEQRQKEQGSHGTVSDSNGNGAWHHSDF